MAIVPGAATSRRAQPCFTYLIFLLILAISQISSAQDNNNAATTDAATTAAETTEATATGTSDSSSTADSTTSAESTSTSISVPVVTVPPTAGAPYMQTSSTPEGTVFIAVGAVLGFLGLAVLAWRGLVAWSVNRSVRQSAMMNSSETKGLLRSSRRKRSSIARSNEYSFPAVSGGGKPLAGEGRGGGGGGGGGRRHRRSGSGSHGSRRMPTIVPSSNSGLFFSPTADARAQGHAKRDSNYYNQSSSVPYYGAGPGPSPGSRAAAGPPPPVPPPHRPQPTTPRRGGQHQYQTPGYSNRPSPPASPTLPPAGVYYGSGPLPSDNTSSSSLNMVSPSHPHPQMQKWTQGTQGTQRMAPTEYLEDLFENHAPRRPPGGHNRRRG